MRVTLHNLNQCSSLIIGTSLKMTTVLQSLRSPTRQMECYDTQLAGWWYFSFCRILLLSPWTKLAQLRYEREVREVDKRTHLEDQQVAPPTQSLFWRQPYSTVLLFILAPFPLRSDKHNKSIVLYVVLVLNFLKKKFQIINFKKILAPVQLYA